MSIRIQIMTYPLCDRFGCLCERKVAKIGVFGVEKATCHTALIIYCGFLLLGCYLHEALIESGLTAFARKLRHFVYATAYLVEYHSACERKTRVAFPRCGNC